MCKFFIFTNLKSVKHLWKSIFIFCLIKWKFFNKDKNKLRADIKEVNENILSVDIGLNVKYGKKWCIFLRINLR